MNTLFRRKIVASFLVLGIAGCEFSINTNTKASLDVQPVDSGWKRPVVAARAFDVAGQPNMILFSDSRLGAGNVSTVRARLDVIKGLYPNSAMVFVGGIVSGQAASDSARIAEINLMAQLKNEFPLILAGAFGPGDPLQGTTYDGARRLCAAVNAGLSETNYLDSVDCMNQNTIGRFDRHLGFSDFDLSTHDRPHVADARPLSVSGSPTFKFSSDNSQSGIVDATTQLYGACKATFNSWFSAHNAFGGTTFELPAALGTRRKMSLIVAADPFSNKGSNFDQNAATALKAFLNHTAGVKVVFTRLTNPAQSGDLTGPGVESGYPAPTLVSLGRRQVWNVPVGMLSPEQLGASQAPAFTAVYMGYDKTLIKVHSATDGSLIASHELAHFDDGVLRWRSAGASSGKYPMCCQIDLGLRPADSSGNGTNRVIRYNQVLANTGANECGSIQ